MLITLLFTLTGCEGNSNEEMYDETQFKMDTTMAIKAYGPKAREAVKSAYQRIDDIEKLTSISIETSDISKINKAAGSNYVAVHPEVFKIIKSSLEYSKLSNGAFDISVGPIVELWGIGTDKARVPSPEEIKAKLALVGYDKIKVNDADSSVMLANKGMSIDLGGIAKGYACDEAYRILKSLDIKKAIINLGGSNVSVIGEKDKGQPWKIGIQHPRKENNQGYLGIVKGTDTAISTSGDYERYFIKDGKRYHHIIDPSTGYPADSGIISDSIISKNSENSSMDADAISTVVFVLGPEKGMKFVESISGLDCVIATSDKKVITSPGLKDKIESISEDFVYDEKGR
jgi:Membrane-associated lipoprotein involved in thiamine biosynthesis